MFKYVRLILVCGPRIVWSYFAWMIKYARHPERYPLEKRYARIRSLVLFVFKHFHLDVHVEGEANLLALGEPFVIYANHYSYFDPLLLIAISKRPLTFVSKKEANKFPFIGKVVKALEGIAIDRSDLRSQLVMIDNAVHMIEKGRNMAIFPEGTRNRNPELTLGEFKPGALKLSYRTGAPILPCAIYGTSRPLSSKSHLKVYPLWVRFFSPLSKDEFLQYNTTYLAPKMQSDIQAEIFDSMMKQDKIYLEGLQTSKKK